MVSGTSSARTRRAFSTSADMLVSLSRGAVRAPACAHGGRPSGLGWLVPSREAGPRAPSAPDAPLHHGTGRAVGSPPPIVQAVDGPDDGARAAGVVCAIRPAIAPEVPRNCAKCMRMALSEAGERAI